MARSRSKKADDQAEARDSAGTVWDDPNSQVVRADQSASWEEGSGAGQPDAPPTVSGVAPAGGLEAGGTAVTITGTNLTGATGATFGGTAASAFSVTSPTSAAATSPAGTGTVDVVVQHPDGDATAAGAFTYSAVGG